MTALAGLPAPLTDPRSARIKTVRRLTKRAFRAADRAFLVEGPQAVREALLASRDRAGAVREVFVSDEGADRCAEVVALARDLEVPVQPVSARVLGTLIGTVAPQGVVAVCPFLDVPVEAALAGQPRLVAVLAAVRDPGNAGTVIRTADAAGADAVVLAGESVDVYNGKCVRASTGSLFHLPIVVAADLSRLTAALRGAGLAILAADGAAKTDLDRAEETGLLSGPMAWLFGNEAWGLPAEAGGLADRAVAVPIHGRAESLNLAGAAAVCLYATARAQRRSLRRSPG